MSRADLSKIERVTATNNVRIGVDLFLNKRNGTFFADVCGERVSDATKSGAIQKVRERLAKVTVAEWRPIILLRVDKAHDDEDVSKENSKRVFSASCRFVYLRRERAAHPLNPKELIEREHTDEFEQRVIQERKRVTYFGQTPAQKKQRADEAEKSLRESRDSLSNTSAPWTYFNQGIQEYELPYSPEAWAGVQRISQTLRETQSRLDELVRSATHDTLVKLGAAGDLFKLLPQASPKRKT